MGFLLFNSIFFLMFLLQQHGTWHLVDGCLCRDQTLDKAEWVAQIKVLRKEFLSDFYNVRYTTKFLKIFKVPAAWPYMDLEKSNGTIMAEEVTSCSEKLVPMREYLLAGTDVIPLNLPIWVGTCSKYRTRPWQELAVNNTLMAMLDSWAAQLAADRRLKKMERLDYY